MYKPTKVV